MSDYPNPNLCHYGFVRHVAGSQFPLLQVGSSGAYVAYIAAVIKCKQGYWVSPSSRNFPNYYDSTMAWHVTNFQQFWNYYGAGLTVDGKVGPQTAPYYKMYAGHSPW